MAKETISTGRWHPRPHFPFHSQESLPREKMQLVDFMNGCDAAADAGCSHSESQHMLKESFCSDLTNEGVYF